MFTRVSRVALDVARIDDIIMAPVACFNGIKREDIHLFRAAAVIKRRRRRVGRPAVGNAKCRDLSRTAEKEGRPSLAVLEKAPKEAAYGPLTCTVGEGAAGVLKPLC